MTRSYRVRHVTTYRYGAAMTDGYTMTCLVPRPTARQSVRTCSVTLTPEPTEWDSYLDAFGNLVHQFGLHEPHESMTVEANSVVDVTAAVAAVDDTPWDDVVRLVSTSTGDLALDVAPFLARSEFVDLAALGRSLRSIAERSFLPGRPVVDAVRALCHDIHTTFEFDPHFSDVSTPLGDVLDARRGVCQDFAHLAVGCLRSVGLAARYVSGYIETVPPPGAERLVGADASHAWCSVWTPLAGWVDFDPTNDHLPVDDHITVGWGRDYADVIPVRGVMIGPATTQSLDVAVDVERCDG